MHLTVPRAAGLLFALLGLLLPLAAAKPERLRLATLVPKGTSFHTVLLEMGQEWRQAPGGGVQLTLFTDGTMGTEADMIRRMRLGQLQGALISITGLQQIEPTVSALQNLPFIFNSLEEVKHVRDALAPELARRLEAKGFVALAWTDAGWLRFFSRTPVETPDDMRRLKMFTWAGDKEAETVARNLGFRMVPLEANDILVGLQTGMIDIVPAPPFFALAGQFFAPAPHMLEINYAPIVGALVVTQKAWDGLDEAQRTVLRESGARAGDRLTERGRIEMTEAVAAMVGRGLQVRQPSNDAAAAWRQLATEVKPRLRGTVVEEKLFDRTLEILEQYRATQTGAAGAASGS